MHFGHIGVEEEEGANKRREEKLTIGRKNTSKKNKLLLNFRVQQYFKMFGQKSRNIYPTLVKAEYNNRL